MKFNVPKMHCGHCTASIEGKLMEADEGAEVACDLESRTVEIDTVLSADEVIAAISAAGFEASPA
jgi:copper chaperone